MKWVCLFSSIACEVIDTTLLKLLSDGGKYADLYDAGSKHTNFCIMLALTFSLGCNESQVERTGMMKADAKVVSGSQKQQPEPLTGQLIPKGENEQITDDAKDRTVVEAQITNYEHHGYRAKLANGFDVGDIMEIQINAPEKHQNCRLSVYVRPLNFGMSHINRYTYCRNCSSFKACGSGGPI